MEALAPGQAGPHVLIMMEVARGPVCVGHEPVIIPPLSVEDNNAMESVWRSPTAPGKFDDVQANICKCYFCLCQWSINIYFSKKKGWNSKGVDRSKLSV